MNPGSQLVGTPAAISLSQSPSSTDCREITQLTRHVQVHATLEEAYIMNLDPDLKF